MFYPVTTQQSVVVGVCGAERSQVLVKFLVRTASRGELLFRSSGPDYIETKRSVMNTTKSVVRTHCSGLPDRTTLRQAAGDPIETHGKLIVPVFRTGLH